MTQLLGFSKAIRGKAPGLEIKLRIPLLTVDKTKPK